MTLRCLLAGAGLCMLASPALADHGGASGLGQGGSGLEVLSPDTLDAGGFAAGLRITFSEPEFRSDGELEALAAQHVHAHTSDYRLNAGAGIAYGITHHLTVSAELPYVRHDDLREGIHSHSGGAALNGVEELGSVSGIGDASLLAKYRLTEGDNAGLALIAGIKVPTGATHRRSIGGERLETEHQPGSGSWDAIIGAAFGTMAGPIALSASALYQFAGKGAQETRLGDRFKGGVALSHRFGPPEHEHHHGDAHEEHDGASEHHHREQHGHASWDGFVELTGEWEGRQRIADEIESESGGTAVWLSPGARFNFASGLTAAASVGVPLWQHIRASHPDNGYRVTMAIGRAF